jgi:hypothetical protein
MKRITGGRVSPEQQGWKSYLEQCGYVVFICAGMEQARKEVEAWLT